MSWPEAFAIVGVFAFATAAVVAAAWDRSRRDRRRALDLLRHRDEVGAAPPLDERGGEQGNPEPGARVLRQRV